MHAGRLRHQVTIQRLSSTPDSYGQPVITWNALAVVHAEIEEQTGAEIWKYQKVNPQITHLVTIRYYPGLTAEDQLAYLDPGTNVTRILNILAVLDPEGRRRKHHVMCKEAAA